MWTSFQAGQTWSSSVIVWRYSATAISGTGETGNPGESLLLKVQTAAIGFKKFKGIGFGTVTQTVN
jgi:hypothetical protein